MTIHTVIGHGISATLATSKPGEIRIGPVHALPAVLADLGVEPRRVFDEAGVGLEVFQDADNRLPIDSLGCLLESGARLAHCPHFGLLVGARFGLTDLGPIGHLMRNSATVGSALRSLLLHLHLHDRAAAPLLLAPGPGYVILGYCVYKHKTPGTERIYDAAVAIAYRILCELCGPDWKPLRVQFARRQPDSDAAYRRIFRSEVAFDANVSGVFFDAACVRRPIAGADARLHQVLDRVMRNAAAAGPLPFADQVQGVLYQMVLSGTVSGAEIASLFGIHERTLRRRLKADGKSLHQLVSETRFELAGQLLRNTALPVTEIAAALKYADSNIFSRAFRNWSGQSPSQWRDTLPAG